MFGSSSKSTGNLGGATGCPTYGYQMGAETTPTTYSTPSSPPCSQSAPAKFGVTSSSSPSSQMISSSQYCVHLADIATMLF
ncbi:hypothetical protein GCK72_015924 [Caenorhabditis remanei]|uniref:Uncharacterized protein n=1 Tax=Caenorhabditis remanei TaxID=31234 RepID=A0A6A5GWB5_CAERE|nr:hypothetical protein GCK72_015924 [Caenorhabditis remanei]KAF1759457.1 hypothetical protein GCK72_015924 [Caenorhabditis remanei]